MPQTDGRRTTDDGRTDGRTTDEFLFHELCWHSQAELKIPIQLHAKSRVFWNQCLPYCTKCTSTPKLCTFIHLYAYTQKSVPFVLWPTVSNLQPVLPPTTPNINCKQKHRKTPNVFSGSWINSMYVHCLHTSDDQFFCGFLFYGHWMIFKKVRQMPRDQRWSSYRLIYQWMTPDPPRWISVLVEN